MTVLLQLPDYPSTAIKPKLQPMPKSALQLRKKVLQPFKGNQILPDHASDTAVMPLTAQDTPLLLEQSIADTKLKHNAEAVHNPLLDTASELHLGIGPYSTADNAISTQVYADASEVQLPSCNSIMPGQVDR